MISSQVYKLRPSGSQSAKMDSWLDMLRSHYNWCLADRIENYHQQFIQGEYCSLRTKAVASPLTCCIVKNGATGNPWQDSGKRRNAGTIQSAALTELKKARPWYKSIECKRSVPGNLIKQMSLFDRDISDLSLIESPD